MRKLLCLVISAMLVLSAVSVNAEEYAADKQNTDFLILRELGIINGLNYDSLNVNDTVSKSTFANYLVNIIQNEGAGASYNKETLKKAEGLGLIVSADDIKEDQILTADEAVAMAVRVLGYDAVAVESGWAQGYYNIASSKDLLKGLTLNGNVTYEQMIKLLKNLIGAEHPKIEMNAYGNTLDASETWQVLEYYRDIYCVKGIVTANSDTSLYSTKGAGIGWVEIDGNSYNAGESNAAELLGHRVEAYIQRDKSDEDTVLYVVDISDNELVIDADLVESVSDDCRTLEYYQNKDSNRTKKVKIAADAAFMLNGIAYSDCKPSDFTREGTKVVLVESKSGDYDFVNLIYAETMIVSSVSTSSQTITNEYQFDGVIKKLDLSDLNDDEWVIYKNGEEISLADIASGDVVSVYRMETGKVKIEVQTNAFEGKVSAYSDDEVTINGTEYELSELYQNALKNNETSAQKIDSGVSYTFRLNANGKIISANFLASDNLTYGYVTKIWEDDRPDEVGITIFLSDGSWQNYEFADRVRWNGKRVKENTLISNDEVLSSIPGLVGINFDKDNQINVLETPIKYYKGIDPKRLSTTGKKTAAYRWNNYTFSNYYYMTDATTVFIIPEEEDAPKSNYRVGTGSNSFYSNYTYTFEGYNPDEFYTLDLVVNQRTVADIQEVDDTLYMVREKYTSVNDNDEVVDQIKVASVTYSGITFDAEQGKFDALGQGDLIKIHVDSDGMIDNYELVYDADSERDRKLPDSNARNDNSCIVRGFVSKVEPSSGNILLDTEEEMNFKADTTKPLLIYDSGRKDVSVKTISSIEPNDYALIILHESGVQGVIIYR